MRSGGSAKIVYLMDDLGGGTGNHLLSAIRHWDRASWRASIISGAALTARVQPDIQVSYLQPSRVCRVYPLRQMNTFARIYGEIRGATPDLVHAFFFWSILYGRLLKLAGAVRRLVENREDQGFGWGMHEYLWLRATRGLPDRVICVSDAVKRSVLERENIDESRITVIRNGLCPCPDGPWKREATRKELGIGKENLVVGMVANFNRSVKGVSHFIDAIPAIVRAVPSARFLLLGRGKEEQELRDKARRLGIDPFVVFAGFRRDIGRFYEIMDISALTSLSEGLSITLLESMSFGLPVVVTRVGGNPEVVVDGRTGFLVPPGDSSAFAQKIVELLLDPDLRARMGEEGRRRVEQDFQMKDVANRYLEVYRELMNATKGSR